MRVSTLMAMGWVAACGATSTTEVSRESPPTASSLRRHPSGDVVLFVRDATRRAALLGTLLCQKLVSAGVPCRVLPPASEAAGAWALDAPAAHASGAKFAVRVTVVQRQEVLDRLHQPDWESRDASGFAGRRQAVDVGPTTNADDLRLDVIASVRRSADDYLVNRWIDSGGALDVDGNQNDAARRWDAVYEAMAERLSRQVIAALPWTVAR